MRPKNRDRSCGARTYNWRRLFECAKVVQRCFVCAPLRGDTFEHGKLTDNNSTPKIKCVVVAKRHVWPSSLETTTHLLHAQ